ncbi:uncharacterized protein LOC133313888 [Gastrolobium bilobum]|uniref:uncharacterized protein LOC133313888 n=1 Tax=Gastrolobium bilobum TaxID=150636 RepID=UPI002AB1CE54|nr:uncharacterized protein LOC133313888 [Gastrolobium bilobum]
MTQMQDQINGLLQQQETTEERQQAFLQQLQQTTAEQFNTIMDRSMERFQAEMTRILQTHQATPNAGGVLGPGPHRIDPPRPKPVRLIFPRYGQGDPTDWIFSAEQYCDYYTIPEAERVRIASFHLDAPANSWYRNLSREGLLTTWREFKAAILSRYGPTAYEDPAGALCKLTQTGTVREYQTAFEALSCRVTGIPDTLRKSIFIAGLKPKVKSDVQAHLPADFHAAWGLARNYAESEERITRWTPRSMQPTQPISKTTPITSSSIPIKRLSQADMEARREKGLCYNCDEKYVFGHKCKPGSAFMCVLVDLEDTPESEPESREEEQPETPSYTEISYNALFGHHSPRSFRMIGSAHGFKVQILIDSGSTHNFITNRVAKHLQLPIQAIKKFKVQVGNGDSLFCEGLCAKVPIILQQVHLFDIDLYVLDLNGADIVLGVQWLSTLGPVMTDYENLTMSFHHKSQPILLKGNTSLTPTPITNSQLHKLIGQEPVESFLMCLSIQTQNTEPQPPIKSTISHIIDSYSDIFTTPTHLPPQRPTNHHIHLLPNTKPV